MFLRTTGFSFLLLLTSPGAHAGVDDITDGNLFAQTRPVVMGEDTVKLYCDGRETTRETNGTCCQIEIGSGWKIKRTLQIGYREVRAAMLSRRHGVIDLAAQSTELTIGDFGSSKFRIQLRCAHERPTRAVLQRAFGDLFQFVSTQARPPRAPVALDFRRLPTRPFDFTAFDPTTVLAPTVTIITHSHGAPFDDAEYSAPGVNALLAYSRAHQIPALGVIHLPDGADKQLYPASAVNYLVQSDPGGISLKFPATTDFIFGGGNLSLCLCETIRDATRSSLGEGQTKNIFVVADATFDVVKELEHNNTGTRERADFSLRYPIRIPGNLFEGSYLMSDQIRAYANAPNEFGAWVSFIHLGEPKSADWPHRDFCTQNGWNQPSLDYKETVFEIYLGDRLVRTVRNLPTANRTVRLIFTTVADLDASRMHFRLPRS